MVARFTVERSLRVCYQHAPDEEEAGIQHILAPAETLISNGWRSWAWATYLNDHLAITVCALAHGRSQHSPAVELLDVAF